MRRPRTDEEIRAQLARGMAEREAQEAEKPAAAEGVTAQDNPFSTVRRAFTSDFRPMIYPFEFVYEELAEPVAGWVAVRKMSGKQDAAFETLVLQMSDELGMKPELYDPETLQDEMLLACVVGFEIPRLKAGREPGEWTAELVASEGRKREGFLEVFAALDGPFRRVLVRLCADACGRDPFLLGVGRTGSSSLLNELLPTSGTTSPAPSEGGATETKNE